MKQGNYVTRIVDTVFKICEDAKWDLEPLQMSFRTLEGHSWGQKAKIGELEVSQFVQEIKDHDEDDPLDDLLDRQVKIVVNGECLFWAYAEQEDPKSYHEPYPIPDLKEFKVEKFVPGPWLFTLLTANLVLSGKLKTD